MYSPRIKEPLVRKLYRLKLATGKPMTKLVNNMLKKSIKHMEKKTLNKKEFNNDLY